MVDLNMCMVLMYCFMQMVFYCMLVVYWCYVDEVDNNQVVEVMQVQLMSNLIGSFEVSVKCGFFDIVVVGCVCGVDVDGC